MLESCKRVFDFEGIPVAVYEAGHGYPLLLIHGSGPGASTVANWRLVFQSLASRYHVYGMDLIGFGQSGRLPAPPFFDVEFWLRQCRAMVARIPNAKLGVIGHSLSGALALKLAASEPKVERVLTTGTMGASFPANEATVRCWTFPDTREALLATAKALIFDSRHITDAYLDNRIATLWSDPSYREYFTSMFDGDRQRFVDQAVLTGDELSKISIPVTMLHGKDDRAFPPTVSLQIASSLAKADVLLLGECSHSIALEHPAKLLVACQGLFDPA